MYENRRAIVKCVLIRVLIVSRSHSVDSVVMCTPRRFFIRNGIFDCETRSSDHAISTLYRRQVVSLLFLNKKKCASSVECASYRLCGC